jgi:hypothetical protein
VFDDTRDCFYRKTKIAVEYDLGDSTIKCGNQIKSNHIGALSYGINRSLARGTIILMPYIGHVAIEGNPTTTNDDDVDDLES